ncbi:MAG: hypothetical protein DSM106950_18640 [Stigonema ocellatum SAG 48.90 = DSM 106950]|nr:hypothetical protein [Stigonema ocellatum SAG 48.90 = DSM 106950]
MGIAWGFNPRREWGLWVGGCYQTTNNNQHLTNSFSTYSTPDWRVGV